MSSYDKANDLVVLGETRRLADTRLTAAASAEADPNAPTVAASAALVGVPTDGAKTLIVETVPASAGGAASLRLWGFRKDRSAGGAGWNVPPGGDIGPVDTSTGFIGRFDITGFTRVYMQTYDVVGSGMDVIYGLGVLE